MKKLISISLFFLSVFFATAQTYHPMPDSNAVWIVESYGGQGPSDFTYTIDSVPANNNDTLIGNYFYNKIYERSTGMYPSPTKYIGAYRNDNSGKAFVVFSDSTNEYLIRDFSKNVGDTIHVLAGRSSFVLDYVVDSVTHIPVGPYSLKKMYLKTTAFSCWDKLIWTEKIGCQIGGIFNESNNCLIGSDLLKCMSYNDTTYCTDCNSWDDLPSYTAGTCSLITGINQMDYSNITTIFPNPFSDHILIKNIPKNELFNFKLYNTMGQMVYYCTINANNYTFFISLQDLPIGVYYAFMSTKNKILATTKLLKMN